MPSPTCDEETFKNPFPKGRHGHFSEQDDRQDSRQDRGHGSPIEIR